MAVEKSTSFAGETSGLANMALTPDILLRIARGFSCFFWGLPLGLMLFSGALTLSVLRVFRLPAYVVGVVVAYCGVIFLQRTGALTRLWRRRVRAAALLLLVQVYLAPFLYWWREMPTQTYYMVNVVLLLLCAAWSVFTVNMLAAELARVLHDRVFRVESQLSAWISFAFMLVPALDTALISLALRGRTAGLVYAESSFALFNLPFWVSALVVLPFSLTMAVSWKAKESAIRRVLAAAPPLPIPRVEAAE